jgi:tRNA(Ile)-lysidine synthase
LQQAARSARYRLIGEAAHKAGATRILTAHTLDDQAETVLIRMTRGSGVTGLGAMRRVAPLPGRKVDAFALVRPLLEVPKARLVATLRAAKVAFAEDPSNRDPRFTRARLRGLMPQLAAEGLDARRLALLAGRLRRADAAIEAAADRAMAEVVAAPSGTHRRLFDAGGYFAQPDEIALRLLGRAILAVGDEGPVELAKLEALKAGLDSAQKAGNRWRRSLAGALVTLSGGKIAVERAPPRRAMVTKALTKARPGNVKGAKRR